MFFSIVTTLLVALAVILFAVNAVQTGLFAADPPRGFQAIGVVLLLLAGLAGGVLMLLAVASCAAKGGLSWAAPRTPLAVGVAAAVALGIGSGATAIIWVWAEWRMPRVALPAGLVSGLLAPGGLAALLLACAWTPADAHPRAMRAAGVALCLGALVGYAWSGALATVAIRDNWLNAARRAAELEARYAEADRKNALPLIDLLREEYPQMGDAAPLWIIAARLPDTRDDATRQFIIARSLRVPDFGAALPGTATSATPRYRHGCLDLIRFAPAVRPEWRAVVEGSIAVTVREMSAQPDWLTDFEHLSNPDPGEHVRALVEAARRVAPGGELDVPIESLRAAVARLTESNARAAALRLFPT